MYETWGSRSHVRRYDLCCNDVVVTYVRMTIIYLEYFREIDFGGLKFHEISWNFISTEISMLEIGSGWIGHVTVLSKQDTYKILINGYN